MAALVTKVALGAMAVMAGAAPVVAGAAAWTPVRDRKPVLEAVLVKGLKLARLQNWEARRARDLFADISRRERRYEASAPGLTLTEKRNLDFRFNGMIEALSAKVTG